LSDDLDALIDRLRNAPFAELELGAYPTRRALAEAILDHVYGSEKDAEEAIATAGSDLDTYFDGLRATFEWNVDNQGLRRFVYEVVAFDATIVSPYYLRWLAEGEADLVALGLSEVDAATEARFITNFFAGSVYDLMVNVDPDVTRAAFFAGLARFRERLVHLIELSV
jgi:hypothetical protein